MTRHLERDLDQLQRGVVSLAALVEEAVRDATAALRLGDADLARRVIGGDDLIDAEQNEVEEQCLKVLALHQPVAKDLRRVAATLQMTVDLERVGDLAESLAQCALRLAALSPVPPMPDLLAMDRLAGSQLRQALDAFVRPDAGLARAVCRQDELMDQLHTEVVADLVEQMKSDPSLVDVGLTLVSAAGHLERIADHATNIAEEVIYLTEGEIVRHSIARMAGG